MNLWDKVLQHTERRVNPHSFATWFRPTRQERAEDDRLDRSRSDPLVQQAPQGNLRRAAEGRSRGKSASRRCAGIYLRRAGAAGAAIRRRLRRQSLISIATNPAEFALHVRHFHRRRIKSVCARRGSRGRRAAVEILQPSFPLRWSGPGQDAFDAGDRALAEAPQSRAAPHLHQRRKIHERSDCLNPLRAHGRASAIASAPWTC